MARKKKKKSKKKLYTGISAHKRKGKLLQPPMATIDRMVTKSWLDEQIPEMLWAILVVNIFDRNDYLNEAKAVFLTRLYGGSGKWLEAGCAFGWVVEQLKMIDVDAYGFDISKHSIKNSPVKDYVKCSNGLKTNLYEKESFNVIFSFETAEHVYIGEGVHPAWRALPPGTPCHFPQFWLRWLDISQRTGDASPRMAHSRSTSVR